MWIAYVCRYPLPNHYTITLEVSRERTTAGYYTLCDSTDPDKPKCPAPLKNGDTHLHRSLNEPCRKLVCTFVDITARTLEMHGMKMSDWKIMQHRRAKGVTEKEVELFSS